MHKSFQHMVMGAILASGSGCGDECEPVPNVAVDVLPIQVLTASVAQEMRSDLAEFVAEHPDADANAKLVHLFFGPSARWTQYEISADIKTLIDEAVMDGGLSLRACEGLCATKNAEGLQCLAADQEPGALVCRTVYYLDCGTIVGRRPEGLRSEAALGGSLAGQWWAHIAFMEKAAVHAFAQLAEEMRAFGAPDALIARCLNAAHEEVHHARLTGQLAIERGVKPQAVGLEFRPRRSLFDFAKHNATEGCVRETYAGLEATWQAENAEPSLRNVLAIIARDESGHAELSWQIHEWASEHLSEGEVEELRLLQVNELATLRQELAARDASFVPAEAGVPGPQIATHLLDKMGVLLGLAA